MKKEKTEETYSGSDNQVLLGQKKIPGLHLIGDFYDCKCTTEILWNIDPVRQKCLAFVETVGLHAVGDKFHKFEGGGITGMVVLAESHMSVHTWPERGYVSVDVYVCSYTVDNRPQGRELYRLLVDLFKPGTENTKFVERM